MFEVTVLEKNTNVDTTVLPSAYDCAVWFVRTGKVRRRSNGSKVSDSVKCLDDESLYSDRGISSLK